MGTYSSVAVFRTISGQRPIKISHALDNLSMGFYGCLYCLLVIKE